jgi:hypothetical protein
MSKGTPNLEINLRPPPEIGRTCQYQGIERNTVEESIQRIIAWSLGNIIRMKPPIQPQDNLFTVHATILN